MKAYFIYSSRPSSKTPDRLSGVRLMAKILEEYGYDRSDCRSVYLTSGDGSKKPSASELKSENERVLSEIGTEPVILVTMGSAVTSAVTKNYYPISLVRGEPVPVTEEMPYPEGSMIYAMFDPLNVWSSPENEDLFRRDIRHLVALMKGTPEEDPHVSNVVIHTAEEVDAFSNVIIPNTWKELPEEDRLLVVDCEWQGRNWKEPGHYIRTIQVGFAPGMAFTIELYSEHPDFSDLGNEDKWPKKRATRDVHIKYCLGHPVQKCPDMYKMWVSVRRLLQDSGRPIVGHNVIADWQWLLSFGVDIRKNVVYDTMLAEHLINSDGPFRLDEVAMRRTPYGRYCKDVDLWVHHHKEFCKEGYGAVPSELLMPYGGADVDCPRMIMKAQLPILYKYGMLKPRGPEGEYPSLLNSTMLNELATDEFEQNGLPVDRDRLSMLIDSYQKMRAQLLSEITCMAMAIGMSDFNPNSQPQMRMLLFGKLGLTPVKTTGGQSWGDTIGKYGIDDEDAPSSSTDKSVLEMLQDKHPIVKKLLQFRRIDQTCKTWLRHPDEDGEGGLEAQLWNDGKLHAHFSPLTSTGRYRSSEPNSQNWPKKADGYLKDIFGEDNVPPMLRTIVNPPKGWMMMEGDFKQAELFTMANISGDQNMIRLLTTPGLDLHDSAAVKSFQLKVIDENDSEVGEDDLIRLASRLGPESEEFEHYMKSLRYVQLSGEILTRSAFKNGIRIAAKSINFGVPYGRTGKAIALMLKAETGSPTPINELETQCNQMVDAWKTVTFPTAWRYLEGCQQAVYDPGYVENPWGFRKTFHVRPGEIRRDFEREAGNFPYWIGEVKWGEFRGSLNLVDHSSLLCYNELCRKVILIQALQECSEGATTRTRVQTGQ